MPTGVLGLRLGMRQTKGFGQRPFYTLLWFSFYTLLWYFVLHSAAVPRSTFCCGTSFQVLHFAVVPCSTLCCGTLVPRSTLAVVLWYLVLYFAVVLWYFLLHSVVVPRSTLCCGIVVPCSTLCSGTVVPRSTLWCGTVIPCSTLCCGTSFCTSLLAFNSCGLWTVSSHPYPPRNELMKQGTAHITKASLRSCTARLASRRLV